MAKSQSSEPGPWAADIIREFIEKSPENTLQNEANEKAFSTPLVGFSKGNNPLYEDYKEHVGPFYMTPWEVFAITFRDFSVKPGELTVISWILPQTQATKADNRKETFYPSERWARARIFGEQVNEKLRKHLVAALESKGYQAVAPSLTSQFSIRISPKYGFASTWSERHAAFASGLGTFGLCDGLITPVGKAIRTGSVVARIQVPPTLRPYTDHHEYCLFFTEGTCKKCISRCPVGAITEEGKDKPICYRHLFPVTKDYVASEYGFDGYGCGLCQTGVPCESKIPAKQDVEADDFNETA
jgi:epoxyqueuosine reductase QueG